MPFMRFGLAALSLVAFQAGPACAQDSTRAEVFAPQALFRGRVYRGAFSPDGETFYFFKKVGPDSSADYRVFRSRLTEGKWSPPDAVRLGDHFHSDMYPAVSPNGFRMVFSSYRPAPGDTSRTANAYLWYVNRAQHSAEWGRPVYISRANQFGHYHSQPTLQPDGTLIFKRTSPDWRSQQQLAARWNGREYLDPAPLDVYERWETWRPDLHLWEAELSPDGSYALLTVSVRDSTGRRLPADLWVTFRAGEDWTVPHPLGAGVNSDGTENFPFFSPDGEALFFVRDFSAFYRVSAKAAVGYSRGRGQAASITIPRGREVGIDGVESGGEWADALPVTIAVTADRHVTVRVKHDGVNLLVAFAGLPSGGVPFFRVPEVVVDPKNDSNDVWDGNDWWFHASARDCAARGKYNDYATCTLEAQQWSATNIGRGVVVPEVMELRIPLRLLGLEITSRSTFGIAFNVTDTQRNWDFWPAMAQLSNPATWARATLAP